MHLPFVQGFLDSACCLSPCGVSSDYEDYTIEQPAKDGGVIGMSRWRNIKDQIVELGTKLCEPFAKALRDQDQIGVYV